MRDILDHGKGRTLFGQPVQQSWGSLFVIEHMLATHKPDIIIELGTGGGVLTGYLNAYFAYCNLPGFVHTIDLVVPHSCPAWQYVQFMAGDLRERLLTFARLANDATRPYVLCDAWDPKSDQVNLIAPLLKPGTLISAHDYWTPAYGEKKPKWCFEDKDIDWRFVKPHQELNAMGTLFKTRMLWLKVQGDAQ